MAPADGEKEPRLPADQEAALLAACWRSHAADVVLLRRLDLAWEKQRKLKPAQAAALKAAASAAAAACYRVDEVEEEGEGVGEEDKQRLEAALDASRGGAFCQRGIQLLLSGRCMHKGAGRVQSGQGAPAPGHLPGPQQGAAPGGRSCGRHLPPSC